MIDEINSAFGIATKIIFGKQLSEYDKFDQWIGTRTPKIETVKSSIGNGFVHLPDYAFFGKIPKGKAVSFDLLSEVENEKIELRDEDFGDGTNGKRALDAIRTGLKKMHFIPDYIEGRNINVTKSILYMNCINVHRSVDVFTSRNCSHVFSAIDSESLFGAYRIMSSKFSIHIYNSGNLSGCFEMDLARNCSNSMFCHNVENVHNSMFCFNVKNRNWAIGNVEVGRERFMEIKARVVSKMIEELEKNGKMERDIYSTI
ncbi:MAG: hypothetical protein WCT31_00295 [Candidatus Micrarchaeia archaeon]